MSFIRHLYFDFNSDSNMIFHKSLLFLTFSSFLLVHRVKSTIDVKHFISNSSDQCRVSNELYWKMIQWYYGSLKYIDVDILIRSGLTASMNQLTSVFIKEISDSEY